MSTSIVILAAGRGTRMKSQLPKVLHPLAGKPMLQWLLETAIKLNPKNINIVCGYGKAQVQAALSEFNVQFVEQAEQLGTGHAVKQALNNIQNSDRVLVLVGDTPLISKKTLENLLATPNHAIGLLTVNVSDAAGLGRIIRNEKNHVIGIVEHKDASDEQRKIKEINTGIMVLPTPALTKWLGEITNDNAQGEYYLTDVMALAVRDNIMIHAVQAEDVNEVSSVNDRVQLAQLERIKQMANAEEIMLQGVTLLDPARFDLRGDLIVGTDVTIDVNVIIEGQVKIGNRCKIGPNVILKDTTLSDDVVIKSNCDIDGAIIGSACEIGPFARIRPGTELAEHVKVGNFVETKKAKIAKGSKVNHLSYIGDTVMGSNVNIGAGTITCNYDGVNKSQTTIEDNVFVGSNSALVAPVTLGENSTIGAGSVITKDVPADELTVARAKQVTIPGWQRPTKKAK